MGKTLSGTAVLLGVLRHHDRRGHLPDRRAPHNGGACYGDSGGPNFAVIGGKNVLAATTITGDTPYYATNVTHRLDTPGARAFLTPFAKLP